MLQIDWSYTKLVDEINRGIIKKASIYPDATVKVLTETKEEHITQLIPMQTADFANFLVQNNVDITFSAPSAVSMFLRSILNVFPYIIAFYVLSSILVTMQQNNILSGSGINSFQNTPSVIENTNTTIHKRTDRLL